MQHEPFTPVTGLSFSEVTGRLRERGRMHLVPEPFTTEAGRITPEMLSRKVTTLCGRRITPGSTWVPSAWWSGVVLARTHETGHCLRCLDKDTRPAPEGAAR